MSNPKMFASLVMATTGWRAQRELLIHNRQGQIRHRDSFGNDPFPLQDKK